MTPHEHLQAIHVESSGATRHVPGVGYLAVVSITERDFSAMMAALRAVLDMHRPVEPSEDLAVRICRACEETPPCTTTLAITEALS